MYTFIKKLINKSGPKLGFEMVTKVGEWFWPQPSLPFRNRILLQRQPYSGMGNVLLYWVVYDIELAGTLWYGVG